MRHPLCAAASLRLESHGLMTHPMVAREMREGRLCGDLDFSDAEQFCATFETPDALAARKLDAKNCDRQIPSMKVFRGPFAVNADFPGV